MVAYGGSNSDWSSKLSLYVNVYIHLLLSIYWPQIPLVLILKGHTEFAILDSISTVHLVYTHTLWCEKFIISNFLKYEHTFLQLIFHWLMMKFTFFLCTLPDWPWSFSWFCSQNLPNRCKIGTKVNANIHGYVFTLLILVTGSLCWGLLPVHAAFDCLLPPGVAGITLCVHEWVEGV